MAKKKNQNNASIGKDVNNSIIQVGDHPTTNIHNNIDGEGLGQGLGEVLSESARESRWEEYRRSSYKQESREILESVFVSAVSGLVISVIWKLIIPFELLVIFAVIFLISISFSVLHIVQIGVRNSIILSFLASVLFTLLFRFTTLENWIFVNAVVGSLLLGLAGGFIGLTSGIIMMFWKPLGD